MIKKFALIFLFLWLPILIWADILIPMDLTQTDHLKAYGCAYWTLTQKQNVKWLLNYRNGAFLTQDNPDLERICRLRGVRYETISPIDVMQIQEHIEQGNMEIVLLEKVPKIAVYTPGDKEPWDDAVTLALTYAEIPFDKIYDDEILEGKLQEYDWLHLHHEDFTGQYGKFYAAYHNMPWYQQQVRKQEFIAQKYGYRKVWQLKHAVAETIHQYVNDGGFLFAMCAACDTIDIGLAAHNVDIVAKEYDGDAATSNPESQLDYSRTFAFTGFKLVRNPLQYEFSDIDTSDYSKLRGAEADYFTLFDFSAKYDPVPTMLTQCHVNVINGFLGQTTGFQKRLVKDNIIILGEVEGMEEVKYLHGNIGKGTFTFYGGHDPEDYQHRVGDPPTRLELHKNSPGYRLILNNVLFPAAKKKKRKT